jgi:hypothetical protein
MKCFDESYDEVYDAYEKYEKRGKVFLYMLYAMMVIFILFTFIVCIDMLNIDIFPGKNSIKKDKVMIKEYNLSTKRNLSGFSGEVSIWDI